MVESSTKYVMTKTLLSQGIIATPPLHRGHETIILILIIRIVLIQVHLIIVLIEIRIRNMLEFLCLQFPRSKPDDRNHQEA